MREIRYTARFKRDYRREKSGQLGKRLDALLIEVVNLLANDAPLPRLCRAGILTIPYPASGATIATVT
jgi:mRNA interferase YafQ